jgi:hypothetical protein
VDVRGLKRRLDEPQPGLFVRPRPAAPAAVAPPVAVAVAAEPVAPEPAPVAAGADAPRIPGRYDTRSKTISPRAFEPWTSEHASVAQITTLLELREEGARMRNCVADYRNMVERGDLVVPITIAIRPYMSGWRLSEWKGFANRSLTPSEVAALRPWMQARGIGDWWGPR